MVSTRADGPADNNPLTVRPIPPPGMQLAEEKRAELMNRVAELERQLAQTGKTDSTAYAICAVLPRAVRMAVETSMLYADRDVDQARELLDEADRRLARLHATAPPLSVLDIPDGPLEKPVPIASGFRSDIDNSFQPCGIILPAGWSRQQQRPLRLDVWLHGRGEKVSEAAFLSQRARQLGEYTPPDTVVLHPYGRYSNAFKFAGEIDVLEAIEHAKQLLDIDDSRITIRGFSMGGAGCWQLAVHYPQIWAAANPGAGFSETTEFLRVFQDEEFMPTPYQTRLLRWYDCPEWTNNLRNVPTVAYSGEIDRQKQAADVMEAAFEARGMKLPHVIGPQTAHKIHPDSKGIIEQFLSQALRDGKPELPRTLDLTTYTLRYHQLGWLSIDGLEQHWLESRVQGQLLDSAIQLTSHNVRQLTLSFPAGQPFAAGAEVPLTIDSQPLRLDVPPREAGSAWSLSLAKDELGKWSVMGADTNRATGLSKRPGLQGPIDDAFMAPFAFVPPTIQKQETAVQRWISREYKHATQEWQRHFRGDIVEFDAGDVQSIDMARNLVLFGTPQTNPLLAEIVTHLPITWTAERLVVDGRSYSPASHTPLLIYPNPLSPEHYVVINSGFTFREYAYLNNARQIPMLPDWAVVDVTEGATTQFPGNVVAADFFDEQWQFRD